MVEARFRRPNVLPKENRVKDMEGYVEGIDKEQKAFWIVVGGSSPRNEYLEALAVDPKALQATFEGVPKAPDQPPSSPVAPEILAASDASPLAAEVNLNGDPAPTQETETVNPEEMEDLDALLAKLETG